jgi:hypothetical protein
MRLERRLRDLVAVVEREHRERLRGRLAVVAREPGAVDRLRLPAQPERTSPAAAASVARSLAGVNKGMVGRARLPAAAEREVDVAFAPRYDGMKYGTGVIRPSRSEPPTTPV